MGKAQDDARKVLSVLSLHRNSNPLTGKQIDCLCRFNEVGDTSYRRVRAAIRLLIKQGFPIGSTKAGHRLITTETQLERSLDLLNKRAIATAKRAKMLAQNYRWLNGGRERFSVA